MGDDIADWAQRKKAAAELWLAEHEDELITIAEDAGGAVGDALDALGSGMSRAGEQLSGWISAMKGETE